MDTLRTNLTRLIAGVPTDVICKRAGIKNHKWLSRVMSKGISKPSKHTMVNLTAIAGLFGLTADELFRPAQNEIAWLKRQLASEQESVRALEAELIEVTDVHRDFAPKLRFVDRDALGQAEQLLLQFGWTQVRARWIPPLTFVKP